MQQGHADTKGCHATNDAFSESVFGVFDRMLKRNEGISREAASALAQAVRSKSFWQGDNALLVPKTQDGRVLFAVPWLGKLILGTTDTPREDLAREPLAFQEEVDFILRESARYLRRAPQAADVLSVWVGLRPLVRPLQSGDGSTQGLSREHTVLVSQSGLVTVTGGKWTTYRAMAADVLAYCQQAGRLPAGA